MQIIAKVCPWVRAATPPSLAIGDARKQAHLDVALDSSDESFGYEDVRLELPVVVHHRPALRATPRAS